MKQKTARRSAKEIKKQSDRPSDKQPSKNSTLENAPAPRDEQAP